MHEYILSLGSNQGDRLSLLASVQDRFIALNCSIDATSRIIETAPWGKTDQADFLNQAIQVSCELKPLEMLLLCQQIEEEFGRERSIKWGPRTMDIDIIAWSGGVFNQEGLVVPHPRMHQRLFVLQPMEEICPDWVHPSIQVTIEELIERIHINENQ